MNTEKTENTVYESGADWVLYDGECPLCIKWAQRMGPPLARRGIKLATLQTPWVAQKLNLPAGVPPVEMGVIRADGSYLGGAHAMLYVARNIWWSWPLFALAQIPGVTPLIAILYRYVAARRHCIGGKCHRRA